MVKKADKSFSYFYIVPALSLSTKSFEIMELVSKTKRTHSILQTNLVSQKETLESTNTPGDKPRVFRRRSSQVHYKIRFAVSKIFFFIF